MKTCLIGIVGMILSTAAASAASLERVGVKVAGEPSFVAGVQIVDQANGIRIFTTEAMLGGRAAENPDVIVLPAGTFNPANAISSLRWARANIGGHIDTQVGGSANAWVTHPGPDGTLGTADDTRGPGNHDRDNF